MLAVRRLRQKILSVVGVFDRFQPFSTVLDFSGNFLGVFWMFGAIFIQGAIFTIDLLIQGFLDQLQYSHPAHIMSKRS